MNVPHERQEPRLGGDPIAPGERLAGLAASDRPVASRDNARGGGAMFWLILVAVVAAGGWAVYAWTDLDDSLLALLDPATPGLESVDLIYETERLLDQLGLMPGRIDGELDPVTVDSIRLYQESAGLPVTGEPSRDLLEDMRAVAAEIVAEPVE